MLFLSALLGAQVQSDLEKSQKLADDLTKQHTALLTKLQSSKVGKENSVGLLTTLVPAERPCLQQHW